jgi:hypothetical protein
MAECKNVNLSIQPASYKRLSASKNKLWHRCYAQRLTRRRTHLKGNQREKKFLKDLIAHHTKLGGVKTRKRER